MKLFFPFPLLAAFALGASACGLDSQSTNKDVFTNIGADAAAVGSFAFYIDGTNAVRGECTPGAALLRANCQTNIKTMSADLFEKLVSKDVNDRIASMTTDSAKSQTALDEAKALANSLLLAVSVASQTVAGLSFLQSDMSTSVELPVTIASMGPTSGIRFNLFILGE